MRWTSWSADDRWRLGQAHRYRGEAPTSECFSLRLSAASASAWAESVPLEVRYWDSPESKEFYPLTLIFLKIWWWGGKIFGECVFFFLFFFGLIPLPWTYWAVIPFVSVSLFARKIQKEDRPSTLVSFFFFVDVIVLLLKKKTKKNIINTELYILVFICMVQILVSDWATLIPLCYTLIGGDKEDWKVISHRFSLRSVAIDIVQLCKCGFY